MKTLIKPPKLNIGDKIATVSLSWGGAGDKLWRYEIGKRRLEEVFGLEDVEMPNTLKCTEFIYLHPEKRAEDLMTAFKDPMNLGHCEPKFCIPYGSLAEIDCTARRFSILEAACI
jgi:muramoyltetrapeptide carboxypeptidase LdcA involved in peptidoglycan recycling